MFFWVGIMALCKLNSAVDPYDPTDEFLHKSRVVIGTEMGKGSLGLF